MSVLFHLQCLSFSFRRDTDSFLPHAKVRAYLDEYCDHFDIRQHIKFETRVELVEPTHKDEDKKWRVRYRELNTGQAGEEFFDAVIVCNGHYAEPNYGQIDNIDAFKVSYLLKRVLPFCF